MCWRFVYSVYRCMYKSPILLKRCPSPIPIALFLCWSWTHWLLLPVTSMAVATYYVWPLFCEEKSVWPQNFWANCDLSTLEKKSLLTKSRCFMIWMHLLVDWIENEPTTTVILSGSRQHSTGSVPPTAQLLAHCYRNALILGTVWSRTRVCIMLINLALEVPVVHSSFLGSHLRQICIIPYRQRFQRLSICNNLVDSIFIRATGVYTSNHILHNPFKWRLSGQHP